MPLRLDLALAAPAQSEIVEHRRPPQQRHVAHHADGVFDLVPVSAARRHRLGRACESVERLPSSRTPVSDGQPNHAVPGRWSAAPLRGFHQAVDRFCSASCDAALAFSSARIVRILKAASRSPSPITSAIVIVGGCGIARTTLRRSLPFCNAIRSARGSGRRCSASPSGARHQRGRGSPGRARSRSTERQAQDAPIRVDLARQSLKGPVSGKVSSA